MALQTGKTDRDFAAGGGADFAGRSLGAQLASQLGQSVVIENRAGGGGLIGNDAVAKPYPMVTPCCWEQPAR